MCAQLSTLPTSPLARRRLSCASTPSGCISVTFLQSRVECIPYRPTRWSRNSNEIMLVLSNGSRRCKQMWLWAWPSATGSGRLQMTIVKHLTFSSLLHSEHCSQRWNSFVDISKSNWQAIYRSLGRLKYITIYQIHLGGPNISQYIGSIQSGRLYLDFWYLL